MAKQVFRVIGGKAVNVGQQRKIKDARHLARMVRIKPTSLNDFTLEELHATPKRTA